MHKASDQFVARFGSTVLGGPFMGMVYPQDLATASINLANKLLGSYEKELYPLLKRVPEDCRKRVINVGAGEGYYAVGLTRLFSGSTVYAFDTSELERKRLHSMVLANGAGTRIEIGSFCDPAQLASLLLGPAFILSDCEGYELELLRPDRVPALREATILVELHDFLRPDITTEVFRRLSPTHHLELVNQEPRRLTDFPLLSHFSERRSRVILDELRPASQQWLFALPTQS
jgi:hypothetical protein